MNLIDSYINRLIKVKGLLKNDFNVNHPLVKKIIKELNKISTKEMRKEFFEKIKKL